MKYLKSTKNYASAMFKGYSDPSEGLIAITKAKAQGLFGKKKVEIYNEVPKHNNNENQNSHLNKRQKQQKRVEALAQRRQGLTPGSRIL